jgi:hypothetical protein
MRVVVLPVAGADEEALSVGDAQWVAEAENAGDSEFSLDGDSEKDAEKVEPMENVLDADATALIV